jgi:hypothetical protein
MRKRVCRFRLPLVLNSAVILGSESSGTRNYILLLQIRDSPSLEGQDPVIILRNKVAHLYPQEIVPLFYDSEDYSGGIRTRFQSEY